MKIMGAAEGNMTQLLGNVMPSIISINEDFFMVLTLVMVGEDVLAAMVYYFSKGQGLLTR